MRHFSLLTCVLALFIFSCSSSDDSSDSSDFAMTAEINGETFEANNPFGTNAFSTTNIWDYFPIDDYVMLQGRQGGIVGNPEINIWLKRADLSVGTYDIGQETFETPPSHFIDLIDNSNDISENTKQGVIIITEVNTSSKIVKGTFEFTTTDTLDPSAPIDITVTNGAFRYTYE